MKKFGVYLRPFDNSGVFLYQTFSISNLSRARGTWHTEKTLCLAPMAQSARQSPFSPASPFPPQAYYHPPAI
jgi:hypothetical protein